MVYFYENIGHIARGDWWIWTEPDPLEQLEKTSADACASQVNDISVLLSFDLHGYATSVNNGIVTSETIESIVMGHPFLSTHINKIPAEYYLTVYQSHMNTRLDSNGREKYATVAKAQGLTFLKKKESK